MLSGRHCSQHVSLWVQTSACNINLNLEATLETCSFLLEVCFVILPHYMTHSHSEIADYQFQEALLECMFRITSSAVRQSLATKWFEHATLLHLLSLFKMEQFEAVSTVFISCVYYCCCHCRTAEIFSTL